MIIKSEDLPNLKKSDSRFKSWKAWMIPGIRFKSGSGEDWEIVSVDEWGNFECLNVAENRNYAIHCDIVSKQKPV